MRTAAAIRGVPPKGVQPCSIAVDQFVRSPCNESSAGDTCHPIDPLQRASGSVRWAARPWPQATGPILRPCCGVHLSRATELFEFEGRSSSSPFITATWETQSDSGTPSFVSVAATQWEIVVARQEGAVWVTLRGPEAEAAVAPVPQDAEFFGIPFSLGTFMPGVDLRQLVGRGVTLPSPSGRSFWLGGSSWELPKPHNADVFVDRLVDAGMLVHDPVASAALHDDVRRGLSTRSVERRVARATGLTRGTIRQIQRAGQAVELLGQGVSPVDVVRRLGYADQPHLTRSLRRFVGQTPSRITAGA